MSKHPALLLTLFALAACAKGAEIDSGLGAAGGGPAAGPGPGGTGSSPGSSGPGMGTAGQTNNATSAPASGATSGTAEASSSTGIACSEMPCKLIEPQCGCEDSRQCSLGADSMRSCIPKGTVPIGSGCDDMNECVPGAMCLVIPNVGHCFEFCDNDNQCTAPGGRCMVTLNDGAGGTVPGVTLCSENCDPLSASSCPTPGTGCNPGLDMNMVGFTICTDAGTGGDVAPCPTGYECAPGFGCFNVNANPLCLQYCDVDAPSCSGGLSCFPLDPPLIVGSTNYGACN